MNLQVIASPDGEMVWVSGPLRVAAAGLPVELHVSDVPPLPPGVDLAAFRVVQEALTNVIKHAGKPQTSVGLSYREGIAGWWKWLRQRKHAQNVQFWVGDGRLGRREGGVAEALRRARLGTFVYLGLR